MEKIWFRLYILSILDHTSQALGGVTIFNFFRIRVWIRERVRIKITVKVRIRVKFKI
jgi:hypothetical protein